MNTYLAAWNSFQLYDDLSLTKGKNNFKFGFAMERMQDNYNSIQRPGGLATFSSLSTFLQDIPLEFEYTATEGILPRGLRQTMFAGYIRDDYHVRPNLTINLGMRYEMITNPMDVKGMFGRILTPSSPTIVTGNPLFVTPKDHNFSPRVGLAWDPFGNGKTSVRAGFGIFDVLPMPYEYSNTADSSAPFAPQANVINMPAGAFPAQAVALAQAPGFSRVTYIENNPHRNYVEQWNLSVQREFANNLTATIAYMGSHGVHMEFRGDDMNSVLPTLTSAGYLWPLPVPQHRSALLNPNYGRIDDTTWSSGSSYNSLQATLQKTLSHGFQVQASYTLSKSLDDGSGSYLSDPFSNSIPNMFYFDKALRYGPSDFNIGQSLVINYTWILPSPKLSMAATNWALGGWQLGGVITAQTGLPFNALIGGEPLGYNAEEFDFMNRVKTGGCATGVNPGNPNDYMNLNCFTLPTAPASFASQCTGFSGAVNPAPSGQVYCSNLLGNAGRNSLVGPGLLDFDFSVFKNNYIPKISETFNVQFRAEIFNIFNRANFAAPNDNNTVVDQTGAPVGGAGLIDSTADTARQVQFALKLIW